MSTTDDLLAKQPGTATRPLTGDLRPRFFDSHFHIIDPRFPCGPIRAIYRLSLPSRIIEPVPRTFT